VFCRVHGWNRPNRADCRGWSSRHLRRNPATTEDRVNPGPNFSDQPWLRRKEARTRQILRFRDCQQRRRRWISIADIADWIATERGASDRRDEILRAQGYEDLLKAMLSGEFDREGRSCILYLTRDPERLRLSVDRLRNMRDYYAGTSTVSDEVLPGCCVPRELARRWFLRRDLPWPTRFDPVVAAAAPNDKAGAHSNISSYEKRVAEFRERCRRDPPIQTAKNGLQGDREWAAANGVSRSDIGKWRGELLGRRPRGRPRNSPGNSPEQ
jgi:hypothetical protein